jgi:protein-S-isoprenylcysteine O-methyltransferase Ste14
MYLGMVLATAGVAILLQRVAPFVAPLLLAIVLQFRFVRHEEAALESRFGDEYRSYKARVRRWI